MPNDAIAATAEGLPNTTRRALLWGLAAASTAAAVAVAPDAQGAGALTSSGFPDQPESPALISAYQSFCDASVDLKEAHQAREWLADEWKHRWPLAPEALLWGANAQDGSYLDDGERDIIGRYIVRDTADLTKRMSAKFRRATPRTCFSVLTSSRAREIVEKWKRSSPKGRTEKARVRHELFRDKMIREYETNIVLAEQYEAETARLREISGAEAARLLVKEVDGRVLTAANEVSQCRAYTVAGLGMKADALTVTASALMKITKSDESPLGQIARFIESVAEVAGGAAV
ncbi:hypothetical protein HF263_03870 [Rhizobium leguminosarum]|uniref:hypothetical protein n=1 Tax=Rhizobium leguminosarum TaxID=384 RepID=UPI001C911FDD|nr:hypothetical protein [Rhizobium leguminosarum]MBY2993758.1 hypothetical protein [Rhizobium leguminosarum]MBY3055208.1 hypothetical protein [Rhizobium leguminosarum]